MTSMMDADRAREMFDQVLAAFQGGASPQRLPESSEQADNRPMEDNEVSKVVDGVVFRLTHSIAILGVGSGLYVWENKDHQTIELTDDEADRYGVAPFRGQERDGTE